jgi:hypothetical protein
MHLLAERFIFWGWWSGFFFKGSQDPSIGTNLAFQVLTDEPFFFSFLVFKSRVYVSSSSFPFISKTYRGIQEARKRKGLPAFL